MTKASAVMLLILLLVPAARLWPCGEIEAICPRVDAGDPIDPDCYRRLAHAVVFKSPVCADGWLSRLSEDNLQISAIMLAAADHHLAENDPARKTLALFEDKVRQALGESLAEIKAPNGTAVFSLLEIRAYLEEDSRRLVTILGDDGGWPRLRPSGEDARPEAYEHLLDCREGRPGWGADQPKGAEEEAWACHVIFTALNEKLETGEKLEKIRSAPEETVRRAAFANVGGRSGFSLPQILEIHAVLHEALQPRRYKEELIGRFWGPAIGGDAFRETYIFLPDQGGAALVAIDPLTLLPARDGFAEILKGRKARLFIRAHEADHGLLARRIGLVEPAGAPESSAQP